MVLPLNNVCAVSNGKSERNDSFVSVMDPALSVKFTKLFINLEVRIDKN